MSFRFPAEWEPHEGTWLAWPSNLETWTSVELKLVRLEFVSFIHEVAKGEKVFSSITPGQQFIKLLKDELTYFLGESTEEISFSKKESSVRAPVDVIKRFD